jgi:hypothetical protein
VIVDEDIFFIGAFFFTTIVLAFGIPIMRAYLKRNENQLPRSVIDLAARLSRMETTLDTMSVELERISEGQRFTTKLMTEREPVKALPPER